MSATRNRREAILKLVSRERIETQEELAEALARQGYRASQSSISRDIATLGLAKAGGRYVRPVAPSPPGEDPWVATIRRNLLETRAAGENLVVLLTPPGSANPTAIALERQGWPEIVGTIAGDDTVFVAVRDAAGGKKVRSRLRGLAALT